MATNKYDLASQALVLVGHPPIATFDGPSSGQVVAKALYEDTIMELLSFHRWRFATRAVPLSRLSAAPATQWEAAYQLPLDATIIHGVEINGCDIHFDRYGNEIHCDAGVTDIVTLIEGYRAEEAGWPPYFTALAKLKLASVFAIPVAESEEKASIYEGKLVRQFAQAKTMDSQGRTAAKMPVGGLARYHRGRP